MAPTLSDLVGGSSARRAPRGPRGPYGGGGRVAAIAALLREECSMMFRPPVSGSPHSAGPPWSASAGPAPQTGGTGSGTPAGDVKRARQARLAAGGHGVGRS